MAHERRGWDYPRAFFVDVIATLFAERWTVTIDGRTNSFRTRSSMTWFLLSQAARIGRFEASIKEPGRAPYRMVVTP